MKLGEFQSILEKKNADFALFYNSDSMKSNPNMLYFSGYNGIGALVAPKNNPPFLIAPKMELEKAKKSMLGKAYPMESRKNQKFFGSILKIIRRTGLKINNIAIDKNNFALNSYKNFKKQFKKAKTRDISSDCRKLREIKTEKEIQLIKKSCSYADKIIQKAIRNFNNFKTESQVAAFLDYEAKKNGLDTSFKPVVASGSSGSMPHYEPSSLKIKKGFCVIDFGVKYKGYCSDITRTVYSGNPNTKEKGIYNALRIIQENAINEIENNKKCSMLYDFVNKSLGKYKRNFIHGLGHGIGIEIHESPNLTFGSRDKVKNNMVFTIEPGVYFPGKFGIRIEDTLFFRNKPIVLTKTTKDLLIV